LGADGIGDAGDEVFAWCAVPDLLCKLLLQRVIRLSVRMESPDASREWDLRLPDNRGQTSVVFHPRFTERLQSVHWDRLGSR
jgi:hypothetical protein